MDERSVFQNLSHSMSILNMVGTINSMVILSFSMIFRVSSGLKERVRMTLPPIWRRGTSSTLKPPLWNRGVRTGATSFFVSSQLIMVLKEFHSIMPWEMMAPSGFPVVPDV